MVEVDAKMFMWFLFVGIIGVLVRLYNVLVVKPQGLRSMIAKQGIDGPPQAFLLGNIATIKKALSASQRTAALAPPGQSPAQHNIGSLLCPFFELWRKIYGEVFVFALGNTQILYVNEPNAVREITTCTSLDLGKPTYQAKERGPLLGRGVLTSNGTVWAHQRKIIAPELYMEKVKRMMNLITESATTLVNSWNSRIETEGGTADIKIDGDMRRFSGDVISRACFGSNFSKGEEIFQKLRALQEAMSKKIFLTGIPGMRYLPTKSNREAWALQEEVASLILKVVKERQGGGYEKDLLQMVLEGAKSSNLSQEATDQFIVDNCKNIYLAGYETTAVSATWCLMLLAANPHWQDRLRTEVMEVGQGNSGTLDNTKLLKMKQVIYLFIYFYYKLYKYCM
ncbi:hypothetical protein UlMin_015232 [Ulmus minor]